MEPQKYPIATFETAKDLGLFTEALKYDEAGDLVVEFGNLSAERYKPRLLAGDKDIKAKWTLYFVAPYWPQRVLRALDIFSHKYRNGENR